MLINGTKFYHVFTAGKYPQGEFTAEMLSETAFYYDPKFREAPVWIGHNKKIGQLAGIDEPRALAWINPVIAHEGKLYVAFSFVSDYMQYLINQKEFKYCSVELDLYELNSGHRFWYLSALGLTNRPAVDGLEPLAFEETGKKEFSRIPDSVLSGEKYLFTERFDETRVIDKQTFTFELPYFNNQKSKQMTLTQNTKNILVAVGLDPAKFVTEEVAQEALKKVYTDSQNRITELEAQNTAAAAKPGDTAPASADDPKFTAVMKELDEIKNRTAEALVNRFIVEKKILPADKPSYLELAKTKFTLAEQILSGLPVHPSLVSQQVQTSGAAQITNLDDPKFTKADGTKYTYKEVLSDPALAKKFTPEERAKLKEADPFFADRK